jgi:hypothetical protein
MRPRAPCCYLNPPSPSCTLLWMRPRAPCCYLNPPSPSCTLLCHFTTLRLSSCAPSKSKPSGLLPSSSQAVCSRASDLPIATFHLLGNFTTLRLSSCAPSSSMLCALELHAVRIATFDLSLGNFTTLRLSSCAPSKSKPSGLLPSSSQAVCSRASDLPIATFDLLGNFTTLRLSSCAPSSSMLCALELHAVRPRAPCCAPSSSMLSALLLSTSASAILPPSELPSCAPSSPTPSMLSPLSFPANPPPLRFQVLCIATPLSSF